MIAALLNLARAEREQHGHVLDTTRQRLLALGVTERELMKYFIIIGVA